MKAVIVTYLPRGERSKTKLILDALKSSLKMDIEEVDLLEDTPNLLLTENLAAYLDRDYSHETLSADRLKLLEQNDKFIKQLKTADVLVIAYPMYNFSVPATIKAYYDAIALKGHTWDIDQNGYKGLLNIKQGIIITTSAGNYDTEMKTYDFSTPYSKSFLGFLGIKDVKIINAGGVNMPNSEALLKNTIQQAVNMGKQLSK